MFVSLNRSSVCFMKPERRDAQAAALGVQSGVMLGAQFLAPLGHRLQALAQPVALHQRHAQRHDRGKGEDRRARRGEKGRVEQDFEEADDRT